MELYTSDTAVAYWHPSIGDRIKALEKTRDETITAANDADAILNAGILERGIEAGEPVTESQLDEAYANGTLGKPNTAASARKLDALKTTLAKTEETRLDVARLLDPNSLERPAPLSKRTGEDNALAFPC